MEQVPRVTLTYAYILILILGLTDMHITQTSLWILSKPIVTKYGKVCGVKPVRNKVVGEAHQISSSYNYLKLAGGKTDRCINILTINVHVASFPDSFNLILNYDYVRWALDGIVQEFLNKII